ncbi:MAG: hypothetical protein KC776_09655 [Myxococcales bacterium]|nr:hypothetical protein [Myxococcales bacterium]MCB9580404.1 hypothetical protein [Polyangiaceae bacterium]
MRFAAAFVVTVSVSCSPTPSPQTPKSDGTRLERQADGSCLLTEEISCPPEASCNPPPPRRVNCDTREPVPDDPRPPRGQPGPPP